MEQRFGYDFSGVRVHSGAAAGQSAQDVDAYAYTVGHDIVFAANRFAPGTQAGRRLLAHELTRVVQQTGRQAALQRTPTAEDPPAGTLTIGNVDILDPNCKYKKSEVAESYSSGHSGPEHCVWGFFGIEPADAVVIADFKVAVGNLSRRRKVICGRTGFHF
jgi:hypothetical protein